MTYDCDTRLACSRRSDSGVRREGRERGEIRRGRGSGREATHDLYFQPKCCLFQYVLPMRFAYEVLINLKTEGTFKCVHCVVTETHARMKRVTRVQCPWIFVLSTVFRNPHCGVKKAVGLTTTLHWHLAFCTFLCRHCTTTTWKCPFVEGENTIQRLSFSFSEHRYSLKTNWRRGNHREYTF